MTLDDLSDALALIAREGRLAEAEAGFRHLLAQSPDHAGARANLALVLLAQGRYREVGPYYEARHLTRKAGARGKPQFPFPEWSGEDLAGRSLLIFPEQGLGDEIMFARFARRLQACGVDVTLICSPPLERLFAANLDVRLLAARGKVSFPDPDVWTMSNALLTAGGWTPETLPAEPYLQAEPSGRARIGVKARGNPTHANDANRSLPAALEQQLLALPGAISLEPESTGAADFLATAQIIAGLDLVVTVDTSVAHLAGALGKPVWILLPFLGTDWRWMRGREDSPWYPSARLFRQGEAEGWAVVVARVMRELG